MSVSLWYRSTVAIAAASVILCATFWIDRSTAARVGGNRQASADGQPTQPVSHSVFVVEVRSNLRSLRDRMINLGNQPLRRPDPTANLRDQLISVQVEVNSTKGKFDTAQLMRELAEIAVGEYEQGQFLSDKATLGAERLLAQSDVQRKRDLLELAKDKLAKVRAQSNTAPAAAANEMRAVDILARQEIELARAELVLETAESKSTNIEQFTKPRRLKELQSHVAKARAQELAAQAEQDRAQSKLKSLQVAINAKELSTAERQASETQDRQTRASLVRTIAIEEQLYARLEQLTSKATDEPPLRAEIKNLALQLQTILEQAEAEQAAAQFDAVAARLRSPR